MRNKGDVVGNINFTNIRYVHIQKKKNVKRKTNNVQYERYITLRKIFKHVGYCSVYILTTALRAEFSLRNENADNDL